MPIMMGSTVNLIGSEGMNGIEYGSIMMASSINHNSEDGINHSDVDCIHHDNWDWTIMVRVQIGL